MDTQVASATPSANPLLDFALRIISALLAPLLGAFITRRISKADKQALARPPRRRRGRR